MRHQLYLKKIMNQLSEHKKTVDELAVSYLSEKNEFESELQSMQEKYSSEYIAESRKNWTPKLDYSKKLNDSRAKHQKVTTYCLDKIRGELDKIFQQPVNLAFSETVSALKKVDAKLDNQEFELLEGMAKSYWDRKILKEFALSRTQKTNTAQLGRGNNPKSVTVDKPAPYAGITLPDVGQIYDSFYGLKNAVSIAFYYCGQDYALKSVVFPEVETAQKKNEKLEKEYGAKAEKPTLRALQVARMATAPKCFDPNHSPYKNFADTIERLEDLMPGIKSKTELTDDDKALIDAMIDSKYLSLAEMQAAKIAKANDGMAELLLLDERYKETVEAALTEVGKNV